MLIAIDHGNKQVKTVHGNAIVSGVQKSKIRPYGRDVLKYGGSYYTLSAQRIPYQKDKTTDERFFILSLFAIAEEIEAQGAYTSGLMPIDLAIGLPPAHFGAQNKAFVRYFKRKEPIYFSYRDKLYSILIRNVQCYPQAFAAAAMILGELATVPRALILDVGGFTADYLLLKNGRADLSTCDSLENGVILLYNRIRSKASSDLDILLEETDVDAILLQGQGSSYGEEVAALVEYQTQEFVNDMNLRTFSSYIVEFHLLSCQKKPWQQNAATAIVKSYCEHSTLYAHAASVCRRGLRTASTKGRGLM